MSKDKYASGGNKAGYQGNGGAVELTQGSLGAGEKGRPKYSKAPPYDTCGVVEQLIHGHHDVGPKI